MEDIQPDLRLDPVDVGIHGLAIMTVIFLEIKSADIVFLHNNYLDTNINRVIFPCQGEKHQKFPTFGEKNKEKLKMQVSLALSPRTQ